MNFKLALSALIFIILIVQVLSSQSSIVQIESGFPQVDIGPGFKTKDIAFGFKFYNDSETEKYTTIISNWRNDFKSGSSIFGTFGSSEVQDIQVLSLFNSNTEATSSEVSAVKSIMSQGKGLLYMVDTYNSSQAAQKFFTDLFGVPIVNFTNSEIQGSTFSGNLSYVVATEFGSPATPITQNISKLVFPHSIGMEINYTAVSETNLTINDIYPIVYDSHSQKNLGIAIELDYYGRIVILSSTKMFSDAYFNKDESYGNIIGENNADFAFNVINWLGRGSGYFNKQSHTMNVGTLQKINRGFVINSTVEVTDEFNNTIDGVGVKLVLEVFNSIIDSKYMKSIGDNKFEGSLSTRKVKTGLYVEIHVQLEKRGYVKQDFVLNRVYVNLEYNPYGLPDLSILALLGAGIIIYTLTSLTVWMQLRKSGI
jgi:hypothetical protein